MNQLLSSNDWVLMLTGLLIGLLLYRYFRPENNGVAKNYQAISGGLILAPIFFYLAKTIPLTFSLAVSQRDFVTNPYLIFTIILLAIVGIGLAASLGLLLQPKTLNILGLYVYSLTWLALMLV